MKRARQELVGNSSGLIEINASHQRKVVWYNYENQLNKYNDRTFLNSTNSESVQKSSDFAKNRSVKFNLELEVTYNIPKVQNSAKNRVLKSAVNAIFRYSDINKIVNETFSLLLAEQDAYSGKGSGFTLQCIDGLLLGIHHHLLMGGSSLPTDIEAKKAIINPQNKHRVNAIIPMNNTVITLLEYTFQHQIQKKITQMFPSTYTD